MMMMMMMISYNGKKIRLVVAGCLPVVWPAAYEQQQRQQQQQQRHSNRSQFIVKLNVGNDISE